jgi:type IV secretory pathway VirB9-like protein
MKVTFTLDDTEKALAAIHASQWSDSLRENNDNQKLVFNLLKDQIAELTRYFLEQKLNIFAVEPIRSLEEYFIKITGNA